MYNMNKDFLEYPLYEGEKSKVINPDFSFNLRKELKANEVATVVLEKFVPFLFALHNIKNVDITFYSLYETKVCEEYPNFNVQQTLKELTYISKYLRLPSTTYIECQILRKSAEIIRIINDQLKITPKSKKEYELFKQTVKSEIDNLSS